MSFQRIKQFVRTLRFRLMLWNAAAVALTAGFMLFGMQLGVRRALLHELDEVLLEELDQYADIVRTEPLESLGAGRRAGDADSGPPARFVEVLDPLQHPEWINLGGNPPADVPSNLRDDAPVTHQAFRIVQRRITTVRGVPLVLRLGLPMAGINEDVARADALALASAAGVLAAAPLLGYWLAGRVTAVLGDFSQRAARLRPANLDERLPVRGAHDELDQLAATVNGFLDRMASYLSQREDFVANAAHELRTPVAAIRASAEVALRGPRTADDYAAILEDVVEECTALDALVAQLLLLSESDADRLRIHGELTPLHAVVAKSAAMFGDAAQSLDVRLDATIAEATVEGNPQHLRQVVNNLLDNALKFTPAGGHIRLALSVDPARREARLVVANTGPGIAAADLPHVFERFYRGDKSRSRRQGAGLGLSICQAIVHAHNGRLEVASEPDRGATFVVSLPTVDRPAMAAGEPSATGRAAASAARRDAAAPRI